MDKYRTENFDVVYEIVNNTSGKLTVANYIRESRITDFDLGVITKTQNVEILKGEKYQFTYNYSDMMQNFSNTSYLGCYFKPEGKWRCGGWELGNNPVGKKYTVTVRDSNQACIDASTELTDL